MSTTWYAKIDCNFHGNRKAIKAGLLGRAAYVLVLCINAQKGGHGIISVDDIEVWFVARELQVSEGDAKKAIDDCLSAGLIDIDADGVVAISGWTDAYSKYPQTAAEKQKEYRDRIKKRKTSNQNVTTVTRPVLPQSNAESALPREEGRKGGRDSAPREPDHTNNWLGYSTDNAAHRGALCNWTWNRLSDVRVGVAGELGIPGVLPLTPITPASANQPGFRNLGSRVRDEGDGAPRVCVRVLEVLTVQARKKRSIEWLSEKAFLEGPWRHAREAIPEWRAPADENATDEKRTWVGDLGDEASA